MRILGVRPRLQQVECDIDKFGGPAMAAKGFLQGAEVKACTNFFAHAGYAT
jgi:hypothetical protein